MEKHTDQIKELNSEQSYWVVLGVVWSVPIGCSDDWMNRFSIVLISAKYTNKQKY